MADIIKRSKQQNVPSFFNEWDPFNMMRELLRWEPAPWNRGAELPQQSISFYPRFDIKETEEGYLFQADMPGVKESDIKVAVEGNRLTVTGKREEERKKETDTYYTYERSFGTFTRAFTLPETADASNASAELKDGVLNLKLPKKADAPQAKQIEVKGVTR